MIAIRTTRAKRGRKPHDYRQSWDNKIVEGLYRKSEKVWRIRATGQEFTEPDERLAVARFYRMTSSHSRVEFKLPPSDDLPPERCVAMTRLDPNTGEITDQWRQVLDENLIWPWVREQIIRSPKRVAALVGIEQIGYLSDLQKPIPPTMQDLIDTYAAKPSVSREEIRRCERFWSEFVDAVGIATLDELTHEHIERYEAKINQQSLSPKSIKHRYCRVRTVIAHSMKRGKGIRECRAALDALAMLEVTEGDPLAPDPIRPSDFWAIYAEALKAGNKIFAAMMLFALNAALHPAESGAVRWSEVDLDRHEFVAHRRKTKVPRVAVLWPETIEALRELPRVRETAFNTRVQGYNRYSIHREWTKYRAAAELPGKPVFDQIRDAAFTTACRVDSDQGRVLAGQRMRGSVDNYVKRDPQFVAAACDAIHAAFDVAAQVRRHRAKPPRVSRSRPLAPRVARRCR